MPDPRRLLIVDDHPLLGEVISDVAVALGFEVVVARSADEFRNAFEKFLPTHVVIDLEMPVEGGAGLIHWVGSKASPPKIILMSGNSTLLHETFTAASTLRIPIAAALPKPSTLAAIREALLR